MDIMKEYVRMQMSKALRLNIKTTLPARSLVINTWIKLMCQ